MKKIVISILAIVLTVGVVSSSAYALFSSNVNVSGITFSTGNADLVLYDGGTDMLISDFIPSLNGSNKLKSLYPGFRDYTNVDFYNNSASDIGLNLKMRLTSADGSWGDLNNKIYVAITPKGVEPTGADWHTLSAWNAAPISFGTVLDHDGLRDSYRVSFAVDDNAGNEIAGKSMPNVTFVVTGTQAN